MENKDTSAWIMQTWVSFAIAFAAGFYGIYQLNLTGWIKAFMIFGIFSSISAVFTLSKTIRDNKDKQQDTSAWIMQTWLTFGLTVLFTAAGLWNLEADWSTKGYVVISFLFVLSASFTLAKTIRDNQGVNKSNNKKSSEQVL
jgi:hypothetical protein